MNFKSLKIRITIWYFISFFIATGIIFTSFYFTTKQTLYNHTDSLIANHSEKIKAIIFRNSGTMHNVTDENVFLQEFSEMPGMIVVITNAQGVITGGSALTLKSGDIFSRFLTESVNRDKPRFENGEINASPMRFMISPIYNGSTFAGTLIVGHPIEVIERSLSSIVWELLLIFSALAVLGIAGAFFIAKQALLPVTKISRTISLIGHNDLNCRITNPGTEDELQELTIAFNNLLDRLRLAFNREHQFIGDIAHELKTPLAILKSRVEITMSKDRAIESYKKDLGESLKDINNLDSIVKDILDLAWSESDNANARMTEINLSELTHELAETTANLAHRKNISIISKIEPGIQVSGKQDRIARAIINIIDNAIKYTDRNGKISLSLKSLGKEAVLDIKDTGIGINQHDLTNIFNRFYRAETNKKVLGNGLGLAIAKSIISAHGGTIKAHSQEGRGTEIIISLPLLS